MSDAFKYVQNQYSTLAGSGCTVGATTITLVSFTQIDGTLLTMTNFGTIGFGTLEPGNGTREEQICFTGISQNANGTATLTGVKNVLFVSPYTQTSGTSLSHAGGVKFIVSNTSGFYDELTSKNDDETIAGTWTFTNPNYPLMDASTPFPTLPAQFATKAYADSLAILGAPNASLTVQGLVQLPTQAQVDAKTANGSTGAPLAVISSTLRSTLLSDYVVDTGATNAYVITPIPAIAAYVTGQVFSFKATNTNTLTSTIAVSGLAAKTIQRGGSNLGTGDIIAGQIYLIEYDGTNFQLLTPVNAVPSGVIQMYVAASAPTGWLLCDGSSYLRTTYPVLFGIIGTTYGNADGTHFNVPDMRGRAPIGAGTGTGGGSSGSGAPTGGTALTARALADWVGEETHVLTTPEMPAHTHTTAVTTTGGSSGGTDAGNGAGVTGSTGGGGAHQNMQPTMTLNFIIKT